MPAGQWTKAKLNYTMESEILKDLRDNDSAKNIILVSLMLTLNRFNNTLFWCFHC